MQPSLENEYDVFISLGSNQGQQFELLEKAVELMSEKVGRVVNCSLFYESEPWGNKDQQSFVNQLCNIKTKLSPWNLLKELQTIEKKLGKKVKEHWGPRTIDLDIIYFEDKIIFEKQLIIPHPYMYLRNFVLIPLFEIAPKQLHPILKKDTTGLLESCKDEAKVKKIKRNLKTKRI